MAELDEILIEQAKLLNQVAEFMEAKGDNMTKSQAHEIASIIKKNAENLIALAGKI